MKKSFKILAGFAVIAFTSISMANPKCSHRITSNTNDMFKNTNPVKERVAKNTQTGKSVRSKQTTRTGVN